MKQLILTADDFGRSPEINAAIERAHQAGFLTQASLMVNEPAAEEAVRMARRHPQLGIGLHLTLCDGRAATSSALVDAAGNFERSPARAGLRYFFEPRLAEALQKEIRAQFARFIGLGLAPGSWDGHAHLHLHPTVLRLAAPIASEFGFRWTRRVREPGPAALVPWIFARLSAHAEPVLQRQEIQFFAERVYGLRGTGRMNTTDVTTLLRALPEGISEIYFHPGAEPAEMDYAALKKMVTEERIALRRADTGRER